MTSKVEDLHPGDRGQQATHRLRVLLVAAPGPRRDALETWLHDQGLDLRVVGSFVQLTAVGARELADALVVEAHLPDGEALDFLRSAPTSLRRRTVLLTEKREPDLTLEALRQGLRDVLIEPIERSRLERVLGRLVPAASRRPARIDGTSAYAEGLRTRITELAQDDGPVAILGELGSGRRRVAEAIHRSSPRSPYPLLHVAAPSLLDGGPTQARLETLRESIGPGSLVCIHVSRLGAEREALLDWIAARHGTLEPRVFLIGEPDSHAPLLRDLRRRSKVRELCLEPLRKRVEDLEDLTRSVLREVNQRQGARAVLDDEIWPRLRARRWPLGLHELVDGLETAVARGRRTIGFADLALRDESHQMPVGRTLADVERELILATLRSVGNDKSQAARILGVCRKTIYNRLAAYRKQASSADDA